MLEVSGTTLVKDRIAAVALWAGKMWASHRSRFAGWACGKPSRAALLLLAQIPSAVFAQTVIPTENFNGVAAGGTPGQIGVTDDGAATYSIPLWVPAGRAGMKPNLSLGYDSRSGAGLLGFGWTVHGLSIITRCARTKAVDGFAAAIRFDASDAFCLNGERLVPVAGVSGADESEYRTEHETFSKIVVRSADALGPISFILFARDGTVFSYGVNAEDPSPTLEGRRLSITPAPRDPESAFIQPNVVTQTQMVRTAWALGLIEDRNGNQINFKYVRPLIVPAPGPPGLGPTLRVSEIRYTSSSANSNPALRSVKFFYGGPPDLLGNAFGYRSGFPIWNSSRLDHVEMWGPQPLAPAMLRRYDFAYTPSIATGRQLLASVTQRDLANVPVPSTQFEWSGREPGYDISVTDVSDVSEARQYRWVQPIDLNGDGRSDLLYCRTESGDTRFFSRLSTGSGFGPAIDSGLQCPKSGHPPVALNLDHDGRDDVIVYVDRYPTAPGGAFAEQDETPCVARTLGATGADARPSFDLWPCFPGRQLLTGDLNGDGLSDLISYRAGDQNSWTFRLNQGRPSGLGPEVAFTGPHDTVATLLRPNVGSLTVLDVNGDGAEELIGYRDNADQLMSWYELGRGPDETDVRITPGTLLAGVPYFFADYNGDLLVDALALGAFQPGLLNTFLNSGNGYSNHIETSINSAILPTDSAFDGGMRPIDFDMDGRSDFIVRSAPEPPDPDEPPTEIPFSSDHVILLQSRGSALSNRTRFPSQIQAGDGGLIESLDVNGDGLDDFVTQDNGTLLLYLRKGTPPDLLARVTNGFGAVTELRYKPLSDASVYTPGDRCDYPAMCVKRGLWLVSELAVSNGNGGRNRWTFAYADGRSDSRGRGFLGMKSTSRTFVPTGATVDVAYDLTPVAGTSTYPRLGLPTKVTQTVPLEGGVVRTLVTQTALETFETKPGVFFTFPHSVVTTTSESGAQGSTPLGRWTTVDSRDAYGNLTDSTRADASGETYRVHVDYSNSALDWLIGLPTLVTEISTTARSATTTRRTGFVWDNRGNLSQSVVEPGAPNGSGWLPRVAAGPDDDNVSTLFRTIERFPNGLVRKTLLDQSPVPTANARSMASNYGGPDQVYVSSLTNALGQSSQIEMHAGLGAVTEVTDANGLHTRWQVDGFGRARSEQRPGGATRNTSYSIHGGSSLQRIAETLSSGAEWVTDFDELGRPVQQTVLTRSDGLTTLQDLRYDDSGFGVAAISLPHFASEPSVFSTFEYDALGRIRFRRDPGGAITELRYDALATTLIDPKGNKRQIITDADGRVVTSATVASKAIDAMDYGYGPFGQLEVARNSRGHRVEIDYDRLGRPTRLSDPDAGVREYSWSIFDEVAQTVANGSDPQEYQYDRLGRLSISSGASGKNLWEWDSAPNGVGQIARTTSADGIQCTQSYDALARPFESKCEVSGETLLTRREYDSLGSLATLTYPKVAGRSDVFAVDFRYGPHGALDAVLDHASGKAIATVLESDAAGKPTNASGNFLQLLLGNSLVSRQHENALQPGKLLGIETLSAQGKALNRLRTDFDANGNLQRRVELVSGASEQFSYDAADRLRTWTWSGKGKKRQSDYGYDDLGNLTSITVQPDASANVQFELPDGTAVGPHRVAAINSQAFTYDDKGQQLSAPGRTVDYNSLELPRQIQSGGQSVRFAYDASGRRIVKQSSTGDTTLTFGEVYERVERGTARRHAFSVPLGGHVVAKVVWEEIDSTFTRDRTRYLHGDDLGSVVMITDEAGNVVERLKYRPFGERIDPLDPSKPIPASMIGERAGFAGLDHDDEIGLINMNARIYDPTIGRFLTPDPIVANPFDGADFNRYAYVRNNPATLTDRSGLQVDGDWGTTINGQHVDAVIYFSSSPPPGPSRSRQQPARQRYDPQEWDVIQLDLVPDPRPLEYPNHPKAQAFLNEARSLYPSAARIRESGDFVYVFDKAGKVLDRRYSGVAGADASDTFQVDEIAAAFAPIFGGLKFVGRRALSGAAEALETRGGVYVLRDGTGAAVRCGRTCDLLRREMEHRREFSDLAFDIVYRTDNYAERRGLEQILYENLHSWAQHPTPLDLAVPISQRNPRFMKYMNAAAEFLGLLGQ